MFAKSCNLPDGVINHNNPGGFVPLEQLKDYGDWAVLGTGAAIRTGGTPLRLIGSSTAATTIATRLGGTLSLGLIEGATAMAAGAVVGAPLPCCYRTPPRPTARSTPKSSITPSPSGVLVFACMSSS
ncbi:hypothetical protein D3C86_1639890 [compost metagenome]